MTEIHDGSDWEEYDEMADDVEKTFRLFVAHCQERLEADLETLGPSETRRKRLRERVIKLVGMSEADAPANVMANEVRMLMYTLAMIHGRDFLEELTRSD